MTRILICCAPGIGDFIIILPMLKSLRQHYPHAYIKLMMRSSKKRFEITKNLRKLQHYYDDIDYYSVNELAHTALFMIKLGHKQFDLGFVLQYQDNENTSVIPAKVVNFAAKKTIGIHTTSHAGIHYDIEVERIPSFHVADYPKKMLTAIGVSFSNDFANLIDQKELRKCMPSISYDQSRSCVALCIGTEFVSRKREGAPILLKPSKNWVYSSWVQLAEKLSVEGYNVLLLGGPKEKKELENTGIQISDKFIYNFVGKFSINQSIAVLNIAEIVVGADTGLMHCAGALNKPSLTLFGCTDYHEYLPFGLKSHFITSNIGCSPCFGTSKWVNCEDNKCMNGIKVEQVLDKIHEILNK